MVTAAMGAGDLRSRGVFSERVSKADGAGNVQGEWAERLTCSAQITPAALGGSESLDAKRLQGRTIVTIRIRSHSAARRITTDWKVKDARANIEYSVITAFDPERGRNQWIDVLAESGAATG